MYIYVYIYINTIIYIIYTHGCVYTNAVYVCANIYSMYIYIYISVYLYVYVYVSSPVDVVRGEGG